MIQKISRVDKIVAEILISMTTTKENHYYYINGGPLYHVNEFFATIHNYNKKWFPPRTLLITLVPIR